MNSMITIYITNYNYANYIKQAIESVLFQEKVNFELLIIDDGSTDESKEIIEKYRKIDNVTIIYQKNKGLNVTNNIALRLSNGKYIMRLDADDYLEPGALKLLSESLDHDDNLGLVFPDYYIVDKDGNHLETHQRHNFKKEVSLYDQAAHGACTMIRTSFLKELGGYNENYKCQDGYELWVKFVNKFKVANINKPLFSYRQHGSNLTSNENRILDTRAQINADYIESLEIANKSIAIIPIRNKADKFYKLKFNDTTLLNIKIKEALETENIKQVIVTSPDIEIKEEIDINFRNNPKVLFIKRSEESSRFNTSLDLSISEIITSSTVINQNEINTIVILDIRFPLLSRIKIADAINTMLLFKADSLISVRADNGSFFKHNGSGMHALFQDQGENKLERDVLYKHVGGITVSKLSSFKQNKKIINGKVGHMSLDKNSSYIIENKADLEIAQQINKLYNII